MKAYSAVLIFMTVLVLAPALRAQQCYSPVIFWQGHYKLSGTAPTGSCLGFEGTGSMCTIDQSAAINVGMGPMFVSCSEAEWGSTSDNISSFSISDMGSYPCSENDTEMVTVSGTSGGIGASYMTVTPSSGTFYFNPVDFGGATVTETGCDSGSSAVDWQLFPGGGNWPMIFPLPANIETLSASPSPFTDGEELFDDTSTSWKFSFSFEPIYVWDKGCPPPWIVSSTIGCQNQSLGEDMPVVGTGFNLRYESDRAPGADGDPVASADAAMIGGWTLSVHHAYDPSTNTLFLGDGGQRNGYQLGAPVSFNGNLLLTSEDGSEVYVFSGSTGQHLQTLRPLTGAREYTFGYDGAAELVTVTDASGNVTTIQRNASEQPTAIVSPYGQTTKLAVDGNGFLSRVTDPLDKSSTFVNSSAGLLSSRTDPNGNIFNYTYDDAGRVIKDADPVGGYVAASRTTATSGFGQTVTLSTAMGRTSGYQSTVTLPWVQNGTMPQSEQHVNTWPDGLQATSSQSLQSGQLSNSFALPDGTSDSQTLGPDPVWGLQVPVDTSETFTQGNLAMNITGGRATTLGTGSNPFTVSTETNTETINGRAYTSSFTGSNLTYVDTTPVGRTITIGLDSLERIGSIQVEGLTATDFTYDSHGRVASAVQGPRKTSYSYHSTGFLASVTDPLKFKTSFAYDADGRLLITTLPDGRRIEYTFDANGNLTAVTPPSESAHDFAYNALNLPTDYTPPTVLGTGSTTYAYNLDRDLTTVTRPDGETINYGYDDAARLISVGTPAATIGYTYDATTGNVASQSRGGEHIKYSYNGPLLTKSTWTGTVTGSVSQDYNDNFWITSQSLNGGNKVDFAYDNDGLLTKAGALAVKRSPKNGLITGTTLRVTADSRTYNSFGELTGYTASVNGTAVYSVLYTRDADGRVSARSETIGGASNSYSYTYDPAGRLTAVTKNSATDSYSYDSNSNRLSATTSSGTTNGTYDAQDRLLTHGNAAYTYTANGELESQKVGGKKTTYKYDVLGNLTSVTLPGGTKITYIIDGKNHRVGKEVSGILQAGFLFDDNNRIVAQLNGSNQLVSQFVYAAGATSPDYMITGGVAYHIFSDQLGSPVLVVNASSGAIAEQITYDEFGNVLSDTNPGFQPFGFAGGLYDQDTKLVRFGARDYNSSVGRWTAKDPILFAGRDINLYGYVVDDPVNLRDPSGLDWRGTVEGIAGFIWDWIHGVFGKEPPVVGELGQALSPEGAEAERKAVDILQAKRALDCYNETGDVDVYNRIRGLSTRDWLKEGGITCPCK